MQDRISAISRWRHRIALPGGAVTPGSQDTISQLPTIGLPEDLTGMSVLDIGCSDGFFSFECEKRGAERLLAVDNFSSVYVDSPSGFKVVLDILESRVEFMEADLFSLDPRKIGRFDMVLFLGVLYHLRHPLWAMEHLAALCARRRLIQLRERIPDGPAKTAVKRLAGPFRRLIRM